MVNIKRANGLSLEVKLTMDDESIVKHLEAQSPVVKVKPPHLKDCGSHKLPSGSNFTTLPRK